MKKTSIALLLFLFLLPFTHAVALGVNKASVNYRDVLRGGYAEDTVTATTDTSEPLSIEYRFEGEAADWLRLIPANESELFFSANDPLELTIIAEPPEDAANGIYTAQLRLLTGSFARTAGQYGSSVRAAFTVKITIEITGEEILSCTAGGFGLVDTETGYPIDLHATVRNTGNVQVLPDFTVDVWDQDQTEIVMSTSIQAEERILPTRQESLVFQLDQNLPIGQYWARVREETCGNGGMLTFNIMELGGISDKGELLRIDNQPWAETDDIIRIAAVFKNLGSRVVSAKFRGTITKNGKTVEVIDTDPLNVKPQETSSLETFFNPEEPGRYTVQGRVIYNGKLTFEKSSLVTVRGEIAPRVTGNVITRALKNPYQVAMVLIFMAILGLLVMIQKEKKKRRRLRW